MSNDPWQPPLVLMTVDLVILTLRGSRLHVLLIERGVEPYLGLPALPGGFLSNVDEEIAVAARRELSEEAGLDAGALHLEQFGVYGQPGRDPRGRVVSIAHLAIAPRLPAPVAGTDAAGAFWAPVEQVLDTGLTLAFDHQRIVADGVEAARAKLEHSTIATAFCGPAFTLAELQQVYEAVWGVRLDPRNFYRKVRSSTGFIVPIGPMTRPRTGRPARLYRAGPRRTLNPPITRFTNSTPENSTPEKEQGMGDRPEHKGCVVILTALDLEYNAVRSKLSDIEVRPHPAGTRFEVGHLLDQSCLVALGLVGAGNHPAAVLAERAIAEFAPVAVLFVGVAGALWPHMALGDVVVATRVYAYHGGTSEDDGLKARPRSWEIAHGPDQIARHLARTGQWRRYLPAEGDVPRVRFAPIAAGEIVHYSTVADPFQWIREHYNDAIAVEMESAGVAQAGHLNNSLPVVAVRGISDWADSRKADSDTAGWQQKAAANAAAFGVALAAELARGQGDSRNTREPDVEKTGSAGLTDMALVHLIRATAATTTTNIATGNARVGTQAAQVFGDVHFSASPLPQAGLAPQISDLRAHVRQAYVDGLLDQETHEAAEAELDAAAEALAENPGQSAGKVLVALKRLRGLLADVADLASSVATIISSVRGS